jgi:hypothetical protein
MRIIGSKWSVIAAIGVAACASDAGKPRLTAPAESQLTLETQYTCMRVSDFQSNGLGVILAPGIATEGPLRWPSEFAESDLSQWRHLWNAARDDRPSDPPVNPKPGDVIVGITARVDIDRFPHIRRIIDDGQTVTVQSQLETRLPVPGQPRMMAADFGHVETLFVFLPIPSGRKAVVQPLPDLTWMPDTDDERLSMSLCPARN